MKKIICIFMVFLILMSSMQVFGDEDFFTDVPPDHWAYQALMYLLEQGIIEGYDDGTFQGDHAITRYEMAMIIYNLLMYLITNNKLQVQGDTFEEKLDNALKQILDKSVLTKKDVDMIKRLLEEFRQELIEINRKLSALEERVEKLENDKTAEYISIGSAVVSVIALLIALFS